MPSIRLPGELVAGDTLRFTVALPDFSALDGWRLKLLLAPQSGAASAITVTAGVSGADHVLLLPASQTADLAPGPWTWTPWVERSISGDEPLEVRSLSVWPLTVRPNPRTVTGAQDGRSVASKALEDARSAFAQYSATRGTISKYRIGEREMQFNSAADIIKTIRFWEMEVAKEEQAAGRRRRFGGRILARL